MEKLEFSTNWNNKLSNDYFTTIRISGRLKKGDIVEVIDRGVGKGMYEVIDVRRMKLADINDWIGFLDTGYSGEETQQIFRKMYKKVTDWDTRPMYWYLIGKKKHGKKTSEV